MGIRSLAGGLFLLIGLAIAPTSAAARYCEHIEITLGPQQELGACLADILIESDARLNAVYKDLRGAIMEISKERGVLLRDAQRAWIDYRDTNCAWLAPYSAYSPEVIRVVCHIEMTNLRKDNFSAWLVASSAIPDHVLECVLRDSAQLWSEETAACQNKDLNYENVDGDLNLIYRRYQQHYEDNSAKEEIEAMRAAQRNWIRYRDQNCALWAAMDGHEGKSLDCLATMTADRVGDFKEIGILAEYGVWAHFNSHVWFFPYEYLCDDHQQSMNQCAAASFEIAERRLNEVFKKLAAVTDKADESRLKEEHAEWLALRERECHAAAQNVEGGSMWPLRYNSCRVKMHKERIRYLKSRLGDTLQ